MAQKPHRFLSQGHWTRGVFAWAISCAIVIIAAHTLRIAPEFSLFLPINGPVFALALLASRGHIFPRPILDITTFGIFFVLTMTVDFVWLWAKYPKFVSAYLTTFASWYAYATLHATAFGALGGLIYWLLVGRPARVSR